MYIPYTVCVQTLAHCLSAVLCEGHSANAVGCEVVIVKEVLNAVGEDAGFAGTGSGEDADGTKGCCDRSVL